jgi:hypothetical protein
MNQQSLMRAFLDEMAKIAAAVAPGTLAASRELRGPIGDMLRGALGISAGAKAGDIKQRARMMADMRPEMVGAREPVARTVSPGIVTPPAQRQPITGASTKVLGPSTGKTVPQAVPPRAAGPSRVLSGSELAAMPSPKAGTTVRAQTIEALRQKGRGMSSPKVGPRVLGATSRAAPRAGGTLGKILSKVRLR